VLATAKITEFATSLNEVIANFINLDNVRLRNFSFVYTSAISTISAFTFKPVIANFLGYIFALSGLSCTSRFLLGTSCTLFTFSLGGTRGTRSTRLLYKARTIIFRSMKEAALITEITRSGLRPLIALTTRRFSDRFALTVLMLALFAITAFTSISKRAANLLHYAITL
jgi:hypothetical protein